MSDQMKSDKQKENGNEPGWERELLHKLAFAAITEQRRSRRWGIFFKLLFFIYFFFLLILFYVGSTSTGGLPTGNHTALVELKGIIKDDSKASADQVVSGLRAAFKHKRTKGIIIKANSPGGSPVQAAYIYNEINRLKKKYPEIPVYAVITDLCASACYFIISAADKIYANESSLVGSIGVISQGFGFVGLMEKMGVERRLYTAGENKGMLDPFSPEREKDKQHMKKVLNKVHQYFIDAVKKGRGKRLQDSAEIFSGLFWSGMQAKKLGLVDEFASAGMVARDVIKQEDMVDFTQEEDLFKRFSDRLGASLVNSIFLNSRQNLQ
jgi:protease-4